MTSEGSKLGKYDLEGKVSDLFEGKEVLSWFLVLLFRREWTLGFTSGTGDVGDGDKDLKSTSSAMLSVAPGDGDRRLLLCRGATEGMQEVTNWVSDVDEGKSLVISEPSTIVVLGCETNIENDLALSIVSDSDSFSIALHSRLRWPNLVIPIAFSWSLVISANWAWVVSWCSENSMRYSERLSSCSQSQSHESDIVYPCNLNKKKQIDKKKTNDRRE